jgi:hypothetical protein
MFLTPGFKPPSKQTDLWSYLEISMGKAVLRNELRVLQELVQRSYFCWPENAPFETSPRLFTSATRQNALSNFHYLFQIDPSSLPTGDRDVERVIIGAERQVRRSERTPLRARIPRLDRRAMGKHFSKWDLLRATRFGFCEKVEIRRDRESVNCVEKVCVPSGFGPTSPDFYVVNLYHELPPDSGHPRGWDDMASDPEFAYWSDAGDSGIWDDFSDTGDISYWVHEHLADDDRIDSQSLIPQGLDWHSIRVCRCEDDLEIPDHKENCHYMMP